MGKKLLTKRDINLNLYLLDNGNGLAEGVMSDVGHLISLTLEINPETRSIEDAKCEIVISPFALCKAVEALDKKLVGLKIERGITKKIFKALGGATGCVHLRELALELINFIANSLAGMGEGFSVIQPSFSRKDPQTRHNNTYESLKNSCFAYSYPYSEHKKLLADLNLDNQEG